VLAEARPRVDLVAVTGASNVTGEVWPIGELAGIAHRHGAELFVDAAQLAPHRPIDMARSGIDHLAFSGHKLCAPFGAGALVARRARLDEREPQLQGGGAIKLVTLDGVIWADAPDIHEAGSPNVVGVVALGAACRRLLELGMEAVAEQERSLAQRLWTGLSSLPGVRPLRLWPGASTDRVGVARFNLDGYRHPLLAAILSAEHAIGVRHGCFCAHPLISELLGVSDDEIARLRRALGGAPSRSPRRRAGQHRAGHDGVGHRPARGRGGRDRSDRVSRALRVPPRARRVPTGGGSTRLDYPPPACPAGRGGIASRRCR